MKKSRQDRTTAEKIELLDCYKTMTVLIQCQAAE